MQRILFPLIMILSFTAAAQKKGKPYLLITPGIYKFEQNEVQPQGTVSFGAHLKDATVGIGASFTKFSKDDGAYIPVFVEFAALPDKKVAPYFSARLGVGAYNKATRIGAATITTRGGFYGGINAGVTTRLKNNSHFVFAVGYARAEFTTDAKYQTNQIASGLNGFNIFFGVII